MRLDRTHALVPSLASSRTHSLARFLTHSLARSRESVAALIGQETAASPPEFPESQRLDRIPLHRATAPLAG